MNELKKTYHSPCIVKVELDNEISLTLDSQAGNPWNDPISQVAHDQTSNSHLV